jgi:hypothetical protein
MWIGYQCLTGIGIGLGMQQVNIPFLANLGSSC